MSKSVTWLLPVKNGMPYLPETLASIEAQTYHDWEILAWDNGSTDGTIDELKKWIPSRLPGRVVTRQPLSVGASLAEMVKQCETELCARIDADDVNAQQRLEQQVNFLLLHPEVAVVGAQMNRLDKQGVNHGLFYPCPLHHDDIVHFMLVENAMSHPTVLFRRSMVLQVGNYHDVANVEDYDLWLRVAVRHKLANLDLPLLNYRVHEKSCTQIALAQNRLTRVADDCFCKNASLLYGCSESEARLLRERKHPCSIKVLYQIAQHLQHSQNSKLTDRFKSESFINASRQLVSSKDVISRLALAALDRHRTALLRELASISKAGLRRLGLHKPVAAVRHYKDIWKWNRQFQMWLKDLKKKNTEIHPTIEFIGIEPPLNIELIEIGSCCKIDRDITIWLSSDEGAQPKLVMKNNSYAGRNTFFNVFQPITIGEFVQIGPYSYINSGNHRYTSRDHPIKNQGFVGGSVVIEDDVWLGTHVVVLPGVTIGKGAIVGASSVVTKDIPAYEVWAGVPAKFIKRRPD